MPFTSTARIKRTLKIPAGVTQYDTLLGDLADYANDRILRELNLPAGMTEATYTETLDVPTEPTRSVFLARMPVQSITSVSDSGATLTATDYYHKKHGEVRLKGLGSVFSSGYQTVSVTYRAGFTNATNGEGLPPPPLAHAATLIAVDGFNRGPMAGVASEGSGQFNATMATDALPPEVERILAAYRVPML